MKDVKQYIHILETNVFLKVIKLQFVVSSRTADCFL